MSMVFVDVGFSNFMDASKIITISRPDSSPIRRLVGHAKDNNRYIDLTQGKKTRSIIVSAGEQGLVVTASAVQTSTIIGRIRKAFEDLFVSRLDPAGLAVIGEGGSE
ncbi:extracellular matrix/biofilm biosynthesis regulator RemA family protein [Alicyclobacillus shizuokensis]|uniref:extracellular matrix/biofilm biosynthesis regulator RemA family protein n=1 Tax=Alicyclobacillus shizuokensis TaxID=392014 RepID=UPI00082A08EC|nr:extracellular matrix/biofilm biosynthesis regulator RemA family protein [Alicyclobacillus shizuokensis]